VGRTKEDNEQISRLIDPRKDIELGLMGAPGPMVLIPSGAPDEIVRDAAALCAAYSKAQEGLPTRVFVKRDGSSEVLTVLAGPREKYLHYLI
jgi:hypothetical protein